MFQVTKFFISIATVAAMATFGASAAQGETMHYPGPPITAVPESGPKGGPNVQPNSAAAGGVFECSLDWVSIQAQPSGFVIGNCPRYQTFQRTWKSGVYAATGNYWDGGYIGGNYNWCGWIQDDYDAQLYPNSSSLCGGSSSGIGFSSPTMYMQADNNGPTHGDCSWKPDSSNNYRCTDGSPTTIAIECNAYGNFRPWLSGQNPTDWLYVLQPGTVVLWRYITRFGWAHDNVPFVMIRHPGIPAGKGNWLFVHYSCLSSFPGYRPL